MWLFNLLHFLLRPTQVIVSYIHTRTQNRAFSLFKEPSIHIDGGAVLHRNINSEPPTVFKAVGNWLYLSDGRKLFDASCGAAVSCLGHGSIKRIEAATIRAMRAVSYASSVDFVTVPVKELCQFLIDSTDGSMARAVIYSSGKLTLFYAVVEKIALILNRLRSNGGLNETG
jgi:adenosylmethionine-8-amino-7-oxononanoate aminotransferase